MIRSGRPLESEKQKTCNPFKSVTYGLKYRRGSEVPKQKHDKIVTQYFNRNTLFSSKLVANEPHPHFENGAFLRLEVFWKFLTGPFRTRSGPLRKANDRVEVP